MTSPSLELQGAIVARLRSDSNVVALVGARVYDTVPPEQERIERTGAAFPYISMGPRDEVSDDADCVAGFDIALQIDVWSRTVGFPEAQAVSDAVRRSLFEYEFPEMENPVVLFRHDQTRLFRAADGVTTHAAMSFEAFAEQP